MSHSLILLRLLSSGNPMTVAEMSAASGLTAQQVMAAMQVLRKNHSMLACDLPYQITGIGLAWLQIREARLLRPQRKNKPKPAGRIGRPPLPADVRAERIAARTKKLTADRRIAREAERVKARQQQEAEADRARIAAAAAETVVQARATRTPLEMAWGGAHA